jgi:hypothetical protein
MAMAERAGIGLVGVAGLLALSCSTPLVTRMNLFPESVVTGWFDT